MSGPAALAGPGQSVSFTLPPEPSSAGRARVVLREVLLAAGREEWLDTAELACTELITNAVLHAHTSIEVGVTVGADELLVEVRDRSPMLPVQRSYDSYATTGRGMGLVAALASDHGIRDAGPDGKTAWFVVRGTPGTADEDDLLSAWDDNAWDDATRDALAGAGPGGADARRVVLLGIPPTLWFAAREHHDAVLRELVLHLAAEPAAAEGVDVAAADVARGTVSTALWAAVDARHGRVAHDGRLPDASHERTRALAPFDLELVVPAAVAAAYPRLQEALDLAERLARAGRLFVRPALPEVVAVRDWVCEQVVLQHGGGPATGWVGADDARFAAPATARDDRGWDLSPVLGSARPVVAADDTGTILAVSPSFAALVGWGADDLAGRRIVTLVPARLREAHVAGFTRHLATGETRVLGVPVTLPVLRRDGSELVCRVLIEHVPGGPGRVARYLAWFDMPEEAV